MTEFAGEVRRGRGWPVLDEDGGGCVPWEVLSLSGIVFHKIDRWLSISRTVKQQAYREKNSRREGSWYRPKGPTICDVGPGSTFGLRAVSKNHFKAIGSFLGIPLPNLKVLRFNNTLIDGFPKSVVVCSWVVLSWRESELISTVKPSHEQRLHPPKKESQSFSGSDLWSNEETLGSLTYSLP